MLPSHGVGQSSQELLAYMARSRNPLKRVELPEQKEQTFHSTRTEYLRGSDDKQRKLFLYGFYTSRKPLVFSPTLCNFQVCFLPSELTRTYHINIMHNAHIRKEGRFVCSAALSEERWL